MTQDVVRVAILSAAHHHAHSYAASLARLPNATLVAVYDSDGDRGVAAATRYQVPFVPDLDSLLLRNDVDAVIVTAPTAEHAELTIKAADAGKHVFCEKPICLSVSEGQSMIRACESAGVKLQTAFPMRFFPASLEFKRLLEEDAVGAPLAIRATNQGYIPPGWFTDPHLAMYGAVMDHTVHVVDMLRWILRREFVAVYAEADTRMNSDLALDDCGLVMLQMENGLPVSLDPSWSRPKSRAIWGGLTLTVIGETGTLTMDGFNQNVEYFDDRAMKYSLVPWEGSERYGIGLVRGFIDAIIKDTPVPVSGEDGLRAVEVALGAYESIRLNQVVSLQST